MRLNRFILKKLRKTASVAAVFLSADFFVPAENLLQKLDFSTNAKVSLETRKPEDSEWNFSQSVFIKSESLSGKFLWKIPSTDFSEKPSPYNPCWAFFLDFRKSAELPLTFGFGNLKANGNASKLNSPSLSSAASPFTNFSSAAQKLSAGYKSPSKEAEPFSEFYSFDFSPFLKKHHRTEISVLVNQNSEIFSGFHTQIPLDKRNRTRIGFSQTISRSFFANENSSWFSQNDYFKAGFFHSLSNQISFSGGFLKAKAIFNLYENRKARFDWTFSAENSLRLGFFSLSSAYFYSSRSGIFTSSGKNLKIRRQIFANPSFTFYTDGNKARLKIGIAGLWEDKLNSKGELYSSLKISAGLEKRTRKFLIKFTSSAKDLTLENESFGNGKKCFFPLEKGTYTENLSFSLLEKPFFKSSLNFAFSPASENEKFSSKLKADFSIRVPPPFPMTAKISCTIKTEDGKTEFSSAQISANCKKTIGKTNFRLYTGIKFSL